MAIKLVVDLQGATKFRSAIERAIQERGSSRLALMGRIGLTTLRWVDQNFASGGGLVGGWVPLRPLTIFGRRQGSASPLGNTGRLRQSFTYQATENEVAVGTAEKVSVFHQFGTRGPYEIAPRNKKALAFPAPPGGGGGLYIRRKPAGMPRVGMTTAKAVKAAGGKVPAGKGGLQSFAVVKKVQHPGLPPRRMLPKAAEIIPNVTATIKDWLNERLRHTGLKAQ